MESSDEGAPSQKGILESDELRRRIGRMDGYKNRQHGLALMIVSLGEDQMIHVKDYKKTRQAWKILR